VESWAQVQQGPRVLALRVQVQGQGQGQGQGLRVLGLGLRVLELRVLELRVLELRGYRVRRVPALPASPARVPALGSPALRQAVHRPAA